MWHIYRGPVCFSSSTEAGLRGSRKNEDRGAHDRDRDRTRSKSRDRDRGSSRERNRSRERSYDFRMKMIVGKKMLVVD